MRKRFITLAPELPVDVHGEQGGGGIEDGSLKKNQIFVKKLKQHQKSLIKLSFFNSKPGPETLNKMVFNGERIYMITNILRLSIYTSMNHSLLFNPQALALQNILRHPV